MAEIPSIGDHSRVPAPDSRAFADEADSHAPPVPAREGLPPGFRMRAEPHYVEQLDASLPLPSLRLLDPQMLDGDQLRGDALAAPFLESIRRLGILQPLIVQPRGERFRVLAGRKRLAAALACGLRHVPCLVQRGDGASAVVAEATNVPATDPATPVFTPATPEWSAAAAGSELARALSSLVCCANLLATPSATTQAVSADLIQAEARRALDLLLAMRVLRDEMPIARTPLSARTIVERVMHAAEAERRLRGVDLEIRGDVPAAVVRGDEQLVVAALTGLITATAAILESAPLTRIELAVTASPATVQFSVAQDAVFLPPAWLERAFVTAWPVRRGALALTVLQSAKKIAHAHGGAVIADARGAGTHFSMRLPRLDLPSAVAPLV